MVRTIVVWSLMWLGACVAVEPVLSVPDDDVVAVQPEEITTVADAELDESDLVIEATEPEAFARCADGVVPTQAVAVDDDAPPSTAEMWIERDGQRVVLPLHKTRMHSRVTGPIAWTEVEQVFVNPYDEPIEAVYVFPLPHRTAVHEYVMRIGDRTIMGEIRDRAQARAEYERARDRGQAAALLDEERPNVFTQQVANIPPGEAIEVVLTMTGPLEHHGTATELVLPTVVGPRFVPGNPLPHPGAGEGRGPDTDRVPDGSRITPPLLPPGVVPCGELEIRVRIEPGVPIEGLASASHAIVQRRSGDVHEVELATEAERLDRDFVLSWRSELESARASMVVHREGAQRYFSLTLFPPPLETAPEPSPRELVFVVDTSGSMTGEPLAAAKLAMDRLLGALQPHDQLRIVRFGTDASAWDPRARPATPHDLEQARAYVRGLRADGGTDMQQWIEAVLDAPTVAGRPRHVVLLTDGYVGDEATLFSEVRRRMADTRIFALGIGTSVNRHLLHGLTHASGGTAVVVRPDESSAQVVERLHETLARPVLTDVEIDWGRLPVRDVVLASARDLFAGQPVVVYGRLGGEARGRVRVRGRLDGRTVEIPVEIDTAGATTHPSIAVMWARTRVDEEVARKLVDPDASAEADATITRLGLDHHLVTEHTSFVAIDTTPTASGRPRRVVVPVALPQDVSDALWSPSYAGPGAADVEEMKKLEVQQVRLIELERKQQAAERERLLALERKARLASHRDAWARQMGVCLVAPPQGTRTLRLRIRVDLDRARHPASIEITAMRGRLDAHEERCVRKTVERTTFAEGEAARFRVEVELAAAPE